MTTKSEILKVIEEINNEFLSNDLALEKLKRWAISRGILFKKIPNDFLYVIGEVTIFMDNSGIVIDDQFKGESDEKQSNS